MPLSTVDWASDPSTRIEQLAKARREIDEEVERSIRQWRTGATPVSWTEIAKALGVKRQTAWKRYRHVEEPPRNGSSTS